jgi:hypothetical protein
MSKKSRTKFCAQLGCNRVIIKDRKEKYCQLHDGKGFGWVRERLDEKGKTDEVYNEAAN